MFHKETKFSKNGNELNGVNYPDRAAAAPLTSLRVAGICCHQCGEGRGASFVPSVAVQGKGQAPVRPHHARHERRAEHHPPQVVDLRSADRRELQARQQRLHTGRQQQVITTDRPADTYTTAGTAHRETATGYNNRQTSRHIHDSRVCTQGDSNRL